MATVITFNGSSYSIPAEGDSGWGTILSNYFIAIASGALQKTGGAFTLTAEADFGAGFGLKSLYYKSSGTNPATAGVARFANAESISWRNAANSANLDLKVNASNVLEFNGLALSFPTITGTRAAPSAIVAGTGIAFTGGNNNNIWFIQGSGGAVIVTANPQIAAATNVGQELTLIGRSDVNTVTLANGTGLETGGLTITMGANSITKWFWDGTNWVLNSTNGFA